MTIAHDDTLLDTWLRGRRSCRAFTPDPVPRATIERILTLAQRTASWNNVQPWEVTIASGAACDRLRAALVERAESDLPAKPDFAWPAAYRDQYLARRRECGFQLYDAVGVVRGDKAAYRQQSLRNFHLFGAPHVAIVTSPADLGVYGAIDCGGYVSTFMLAAQANGVATIAQAALASYPEVLREQLNLSEDRKVVCAVSFGFEDATHASATYRTSRAPLSEVVTWQDE